MPTPSRADRWVDSAAWREACDWIAQSGRIPPDARFLTPPSASTFKWHAQRGEVVNWKEVPQDAASLVQWRQRLQEVRSTNDPDSSEQTAARLAQLGAEYQAGYVITEARRRLPLEVVHENDVYIVYRLPEAKAP